jgi:RNA polymerase sigma-70 factor (ECF subfamily)
MVSELALAPIYQSTVHVDLAAAEEHALIDRARQGDIEAFDAIMMRYETRLLRFLTGLVGDIEVARELCQDTFLAAYQALPRIKGELRLSAWLHTIALNRARSHHRRKRFRIFVSIEDHDLPSPTPDLQDALADSDLVQRTLAKIPTQYAEILLLQITGGLSCREIAGVVNSTEGAVKVRLMRARDAFRRAYDQEVRERCTT